MYDDIVLKYPFYERNGDYMKKKMLITALLTAVSIVLVSAPVKADTVPAVQFTDEQIKLAQLNWNAYVEMTKATDPAIAQVFATPITSMNPDSVIAKAAIIHHHTPACYYMLPPQIVLNPCTPVYTCNPYYIYYPSYYYTFQYR